uniref:28 kDa Metastriate family member n=1 Tax=Rhipicephalus zambeziensis TaxID=60191 RepID=A0A224YBM2_9ACAR
MNIYIHRCSSACLRCESNFSLQELSMMLKKYLCFLCVFVAQYCSGNAQVSATTPLPDKIGENVTAYIYVYYNSTYLPRDSVSPESRDSSASEDETPNIFKKLFKEDDNIAVNYTGNNALNASGTLENLLQRKSEEARMPTGIVFYYTNSTLLNEQRRGDGMPSNVNYESTWGTFCTTSPSGAVVKHKPNSKDNNRNRVMHTILAVTKILGAYYTSNGIHPSQKRSLKAKLMQCNPATTGNLPQMY